MPESFSNFMSRNKKRQKNKGTTIVPGLGRAPTSAETHPGDPRFKQRLSLSAGDKIKDERETEESEHHDNEIDADIDGDGIVGVEDLLTLIGDWGECPECPGDLNGDGVVDIEDLLILIGQWGDGPAPTPEQVMSLISSNSAVGAEFRGVTHAAVYEQNNFTMSFNNFMNKIKKKKKVSGVTGLPTFSYNDPRYQQKLRIDDDDEDEGAERGNLPCPPYCGGNPDDIVTCARPPCFVRPDEPDPGCFWGVTEFGACADEYEEPQCIEGGVWPDCNDAEHWCEPWPECMGPEGTDETDDLFDPWKYRGVTNIYSLYYHGDDESEE